MALEIGYNQAELTWGASKIPDADVRRVLETVVDLGGSRVRMSAQLGTLADIDRVVLLCREYDLKPLLMLKNNPSLGSAKTVGSFGALCKTVATRYGPLGVGNLQNSVTDLQLFNESNLLANEPVGNTPASYTQFLQAGYEAIKSVHTSSTVITAGTTSAAPFSGIDMDPVEWYRGIIAAGGGQWFDAIAMHYYNNDASVTPGPLTRQFKYITDVRALMVANGLGAKKIWVTEVGVSFPSKGLATLLDARNRLKLMLDDVLALDFVAGVYIYNAKDYAGGDTGGAFGMVTKDFVRKSPMYEYAQSLGEVDSGDVTAPDPPTGLMFSDVTSSSAAFNWATSPAIDGVTNYRLKTVAGVQLVDTQNTFCTATGLPSGTPQSFYLTAVDAAGNESDPSDTVTLTTDAPSGSQASFAYQFTGSEVPTVFTQLGLGFTVSGGVALPVAPTSDGEYVTVAPYTLDAQSPDHSSRISLAGTAAGPDRTALAIVRMKPDGTEWIAAASPGGGSADSLLIVMRTGGGTPVTVAAMNTTPGGAADDLELTPVGNVYTARIIGPGSTVKAELQWTDTNGIYPGATNLRPAPGWRHKRVGGVNYPPPGITRWAATDVSPILSGGGFDLWMLGAIDEEDYGLVISTGLWEAAL